MILGPFEKITFFGPDPLPLAYQRQHQRENAYKTRRLTVFEVCDDGRWNLAISNLLA